MSESRKRRTPHGKKTGFVFSLACAYGRNHCFSSRIIICALLDPGCLAHQNSIFSNDVIGSTVLSEVSKMDRSCMIVDMHAGAHGDEGVDAPGRIRVRRGMIGLQSNSPKSFIGRWRKQISHSIINHLLLMLTVTVSCCFPIDFVLRGYLVSMISFLLSFFSLVRIHLSDHCCIIEYQTPLFR